MGKILISILVALLSIGINLVHCKYYHTKSGSIPPRPQKVTHLHFYFFVIHSNHQNASTVEVAHPNQTNKSSNFGTVYAIDAPLREGIEETSKLIGNAQGLYVLSSQRGEGDLTIFADYAFTVGSLKGSSISVLSRKSWKKPSDVAVVGGSGRFRMAYGFADTRLHIPKNEKNVDGIIEYNVTVFHY